MAEKKAEPQLHRKGREGNRWVNVRPDGPEVADWFEKNVYLHEGLDHEHYVQGVTLIQQTEKSKDVVGVTQDGKPLISDSENLVFVPYAKVETRVKYFHDLMAAHDEWLGVIEPVEVEGGKSKGYPPGFFSMTIVPTKNGLKEEQGRFLCCSMRVRIYEAASVEMKEVRNMQTGEMQVYRVGKMVLDGTSATKMVPLLNRYGEPDQNAIMKAETGAVGRALGLAGMLVIPGTGVATAEDVQEAQAGAAPIEAQPEQGESASVPPEQVRSTNLRAAAEGIAKLRQDFPDDYRLFTEWTQSRGIGGKLDELDDLKLRGLVTKLRHATENAQAKEQEEGSDAEREDPTPEPEAAGADIPAAPAE